MRRLMVLPALVLAISAAPGCRRAVPPVETIEDGNRPALNVVQVAEPRTATQLMSGFHSVERNAWRWTMGRFAVALQPPAGAAQNGATLELRFSIPEMIVKRLGPVTLSARVEGTPLIPETFSNSGPRIYSRAVPAGALKRPPVMVSFALDKFLKAGEVEGRELGVVVTTVSLLPRRQP